MRNKTSKQKNLQRNTYFICKEQGDQIRFSKKSAPQLASL